MSLFLRPWNNTTQTNPTTGTTAHATARVLKPCETLANITIHETGYFAFYFKDDHLHTSPVTPTYLVDGVPLLCDTAGVSNPAGTVVNAGNLTIPAGIGIFTRAFECGHSIPYLFGTTPHTIEFTLTTPQTQPLGDGLVTFEPYWTDMPFPTHTMATVFGVHDTYAGGGLYYRMNGANNAFPPNTGATFQMEVTATSYNYKRDGVTQVSIPRTVQYSLTNAAAGTLSSTAVLPIGTAVSFTAATSATAQTTYVQASVNDGQTVTGTAGGRIDVPAVTLTGCPTKPVTAGSVIS